MKRFAIVRILGNELPPRDIPGMKLKILSFILQNEASHPATDKWWIVNHIYDPIADQATCALLQQHRANYLYLPFNQAAFNQAKNNTDRMVAAIPINYCRNLAANFGRSVYDYTGVLDGDCYFPRDTWTNIVEYITAHPSPYYSVPMVRSSIDLELKQHESDLLDEAQLIFGKNAELRFNESLPWGNFRDKLDLLHRLGHYDFPDAWHTLERTDQCQRAGVVHHLASGPLEYELERNANRRCGLLYGLREEAFNLLLSRIGGLVIQ